MNSFPLSMNLKGRRVAIAGGGTEALRKARLFVSAGADVVLVAAEIEQEAKEELSNAASLIEATPAPADFKGSVLAVIADAEESVAARYAKWARQAGALVNVVDQPALCDFTTPSIIDRGDIVIGISTGGAAPVLGQQLRGRIEAMAPARLGDLAAFAKSFRSAVKATIAPAERRMFWKRVFNGPVAAR
ncbi:MAG: bifunctional precorrin-2 dehydrogenase/sirohydrochlorin ferrochelatase, partial [Pseudomonadota bacterium]